MNLRPGDVGIRLQLAGVYRRVGNVNSALEMYQGIVTEKPGSTEAASAARAIEQIQRQATKP